VSKNLADEVITTLGEWPDDTLEAYGLDNLYEQALIDRAAIEQPKILPDEFDLLGAMSSYGGSFSSYLAGAWRHADSGNLRILRHNFNNLLETYRQFLPLKDKQ